MIITREAIEQTESILLQLLFAYFSNRYITPALIPLEKRFESNIINIMERVNQYPLQITGLAITGSFIYAISSTNIKENDADSNNDDDNNNENNNISRSKQILRGFSNGLLVSTAVISIAQIVYFSAYKHVPLRNMTYVANNPATAALALTAPYCIELALPQNRIETVEDENENTAVAENR